jgi:hypothetical protein
MTYLILILLFIAVFGFLTWRIVRGVGTSSDTAAPERYVCPVCNERDCQCHKARGPN